MYDDPFGQNRFSKELKKKLQESIRSNVATLTDQPNIESSTAEKSFPQQKNGWDCGPICLSNIRDYVKGENVGRFDKLIGNVHQECNFQTANDKQTFVIQKTCME